MISDFWWKLDLIVKKLSRCYLQFNPKKIYTIIDLVTMNICYKILHVILE